MKTFFFVSQVISFTRKKQISKNIADTTFKEHTLCTVVEDANAVSMVSLRVNIFSFKYSTIPRADK